MMKMQRQETLLKIKINAYYTTKDQLQAAIRRAVLGVINKKNVNIDAYIAVCLSDKLASIVFNASPIYGQKYAALTFQITKKEFKDITIQIYNLLDGFKLETLTVNTV